MSARTTTTDESPDLRERKTGFGNVTEQFEVSLRRNTSPFVRDALAVCMIALVAATAYLPIATNIDWFSDDYVLVYGLNRDVPSLEQSLKAGGHGRYSVHRLLCYPLIGYLGHTLGPSGAHALLVALHATCGVLVFTLLRQLYFRTAAALLASSLFIVSPLASQPILWWSAVCTIVSTLCILLAGNVHVRYAVTRRTWLLPLTAALAFTSLLLYELWLPGFVLLWGVCFGRVALRSRKGLVSDLIRSFVLSAPLLVPYALWAVLFKLSPPEGIHSPTFSITRAVIVVASIHVRAAQQLIEWPTVRSAIVAIRHSGLFEIVALIALSALIAWIASQWRRMNPILPPRRRDFTAKRLASRLLVAWSDFLASRLVFILQGGVSMHSRHSYGAAIALGIVAVLLFDAARDRVSSKLLRAALTIALGGLLAVWGLSARGVAFNYAAISNAERDAPRTLLSELDRDADRSDCPVFIIGSPGYFPGEFDFFSEDHGTWLRFRMQKQGIAREFITAADRSEVADQIEASRDCSPEGPRFFRLDPNGLTLETRH